MTVLPDAENLAIVGLSSFVFTKYRKVTDRQIDRRTDRFAVLLQRCKTVENIVRTFID